MSYVLCLKLFRSPVSVTFSPAMGARNQVGIGLSYRTASLCSLATQCQTRFLESIPRPIAGLSRTRSYKKGDEPLLNLTAALSRCSRQKVLMCTQKRELESPLKIQGV
jgi:hypothetical protein